jgi:hypothetical protein
LSPSVREYVGTLDGGTAREVIADNPNADAVEELACGNENNVVSRVDCRGTMNIAGRLCFGFGNDAGCQNAPSNNAGATHVLDTDAGARLVGGGRLDVAQVCFPADAGVQQCLLAPPSGGMTNVWDTDAGAHVTGDLNVDGVTRSGTLMAYSGSMNYGETYAIGGLRVGYNTVDIGSITHYEYPIDYMNIAAGTCGGFGDMNAPGAKTNSMCFVSTIPGGSIGPGPQVLPDVPKYCKVNTDSVLITLCCPAGGSNCVGPVGNAYYRDAGLPEISVYMINPL